MVYDVEIDIFSVDAPTNSMTAFYEPPRGSCQVIYDDRMDVFRCLSVNELARVQSVDAWVVEHLQSVGATEREVVARLGNCIAAPSVRPMCTLIDHLVAELSTKVDTPVPTIPWMPADALQAEGTDSVVLELVWVDTGIPKVMVVPDNVIIGTHVSVDRDNAVKVAQQWVVDKARGNAL